MSRWHWPVVIGLFVGLQAGCTRPSARTKIQLSVPNPAKATAPTETATTKDTPLPKTRDYTITPDRDEPGIVHGRVVWEGPAVEPASDRLRVNSDNRGIAGTVIWIEDVPPGENPPGGELQLLQKEQSFRPRVQAARKGASLRLLAADAQASFKATGAADFNLRLTQGKQQTRPLDQPGLITIRSELQPDAAAYLWVFEHPAFAVTDAEGRFRLPQVPAGEYQVLLWHEGWQSSGSTALSPVRKQLTVELGKDRGAKIQWQLSNP